MMKRIYLTVGKSIAIGDSKVLYPRHQYCNAPEELAARWIAEGCAYAATDNNTHDAPANAPGPMPNATVAASEQPVEPGAPKKVEPKRHAKPEDNVETMPEAKSDKQSKDTPPPSRRGSRKPDKE